MTAPARVDSVIVQKITAHYAMIDSDIALLQAQIERQILVTYRQTIQAQLIERGCQKLATSNDAQSLKWIAEKARKDAEGIAQTYNRELSSKVGQIHAKNKKTNRYGFMSALDTWLASRTPRKTSSIALNTMTQARAYAQDRFIRENKITGRFAMVGPPPVCRICIRIAAKGPLTWEECQKPTNFVPAHINCPHKRQALVIKKIPCDEMTWTG
jgi:hypothetical protein